MIKGILPYRNLKILIQVVFWLGYLTLASLIFAIIVPIDWAIIRCLGVGLCHIGLVYFHLYLLLPRFFDKKKYLGYAIGVFAVIFLVALLKVSFDKWLIDISQLDGELKRFRYTQIPFISAVIANVAFIFLTTPVRWMDDFYKRKELQRQSQQAKLEAELKFLKTQLNPHFLFNTLNNLYSLAFTGSEQTAPMILKLSEMMRYLLYESDAKQVPLSQEVNYLNNFIELQQLKTAAPQSIEFITKGTLEGKQIPPLLFVPLFENAFKHGNLDEGGWLKSELGVTDKRISFSIENSYLTNQKKDKVGGIGLENVKKRLAMLFPEHHSFELKNENGIFHVHLHFQLS